ncbi:hypothetical protein F443_04125 [Phytophthora nicotianae P1569]|uniref:Uncharacterized protein n=1 Tax=Phytophthora nicotianae P1569 TaxID=1317065 RepID=V9FPW2_PHYNI|nr:hypothetical protein F443_04125 [Phytophthora nicotianae P1569]
MSKYKSHQIKNPNPSVGKSKQPAFSPRGTNANQFSPSVEFARNTSFKLDEMADSTQHTNVVTTEVLLKFEEEGWDTTEGSRQLGIQRTALHGLKSTKE